MSDKTHKQIIAELNDAWFNFDVDHDKIINPFERLITDDPEEFYKRLTCLFMTPEYFSFICKHVLNINLLPMQALILCEMWNRKFPMLVGSRGLGKLLRPDARIRTRGGWTSMEKVSVGDQVYGSDGRLCNVVHKTPLQSDVVMYRVTLRDGRTIDCCEDHMWKVWDKNKNRKGVETVWSELKTKDMVDNYFRVRKDSKSKLPKETKEYRYALPVNMPLMDEDERDLVLDPYVVGVLLGDGCVTQKTITISSLDKDLLARFERRLPDGYQLSGSNNDKDYRVVRTTNEVVPFHHLCKEIGIWGHDSHTKFIPKEYKFASYDQRLELVKGLMDTDGWSNKITIEYYTVSEKLCDDMTDMVRSLGISCRRTIKEAWLNGERYSDCHRLRIYTDQPIFSMARKLEYTSHEKSKAGKSKYEKVFIVGIERIENGEGYCIQVDSDDSTYITDDYIVTHNTFILSLYSMLRALLMPNRKVVVIGAAFRQSKFLHEYMENIWNNAPILRDMCESSGPKKDVDMCKMILNGSTVVALPIGDGCVTSDSMVTFDDGFGYINRDSVGKIVQTRRNVWGNGDFCLSDESYNNGIKATKRITTKRGFSIEGTHNHKIRTPEGWARFDSLSVGDEVLIDVSPRWHNGDSDCSIDEAYALGLMIGDGNYTNQYYMSFATKDPELVNAVSAVGDFKQRSDEVHFQMNGKKEVRAWLDFWGMDFTYTKDKVIPSKMLCASKDKMSALISGLFDTDGHVFLNTKRGVSCSINFTNTSRDLVMQLQYILLHYGIVSTVRSRQRKNWNRVYELGIYGPNILRFHKQIGFRLKRKSDLVQHAIDNKERWSSQEKYHNDALVCVVENIEDSEAETFDIHVPETHEYCANGFFSHNTKIRGQRANDIVADEFASHSREIFENVIAGFAAVSASPVENVKRLAMEAKAKELGVDISSFTKSADSTTQSKSNQIIVSGTAYYDFNHFAEYWKRWKSIIETKGDPRKLSNEVFGGEPVPASFNWKDYSIIRIPVDLVPRGFMDEGQIARSKATVHNGIYLMEFGAVFTKDSQGFFKRSLIESCVGTDTKPVQTMSSGDVYFDPILKGKSNYKYVMAIDPASEVDNFSIIITELHPDHRRIVHCWTTTRQDHKERVKRNLTEENNFYSYCARKIRDLMTRFNIVHIAMDSQGGGYSVAEALHDKNQLKEGEIPIWPVINEDKPQDTDDETGLHILEMCQFANYQWYSDANHNLRKDLEDKVLLFPRFDPITIGLSIEEDKANNRLYDTLEDCVMEIEELKDELTLIEITRSATGRERWDTPEVKIGVGKKERMRKDRYSSLIMANAASRALSLEAKPEYNIYGGFAVQDGAKKKKDEATFSGPAWFTGQMNGLY